MASRKEEKERLRQAREEAERQERSQERKRLILGYGVAGLISLAVLAGIVFAITSGGDGNDLDGNRDAFGEFGVIPEGAVADERDGTPPPELANQDLDASAEEANCELLRDQRSDGNTHYGNEDRFDPADYSTKPPHSGDHLGTGEPGAGALAAGPYLEHPPLARSIHSLEHGRIHIQYDPGLPEADQLALKGIFDASPTGMIISPNPDMDYEIAVTAWTQLLGCESFEGQATSDAIQNFRNEFLGRGPEPVPFGS